MAKRMTIMVTALIIVFGGILGFNIFRTHMIKQYLADYAPPAVNISTVTAEAQSWQSDLTAVGNFIAINGVDVNSEAAGNVVDISFHSGQYITKGTLMMTIDDSVDQATLKDNKANLDLQAINYKRQVNLFKRGATPSSNVDEAKANLQRAEASTQKTQAQIAQKHIKAPFSGRLGIRQINLGQYISPGSTNIVTLQSLDPLFLEFYLPEQNLNRIFEGQTVRFSVESFPGRLFEGKISAINSKIDTNTHNVLVQATIPNCSDDAIASGDSKQVTQTILPLSGDKLTRCTNDASAAEKISDFAFLPGMFANVQVMMPSKENVIVLPMTAVSYSLYGDSVFKIKQSGKDKQGKPLYKTYRQYIHTGEQRGNYVVVTEGLKEGTQVVNSGQLKLRNGTPVVINNSVKQTNAKDIDKLGQ